ncbi:MAG TPA: sugar phosphate isomerase/epimerase family protein [Blastocatellia bacterium]|nr:sugar phosphate isomerase/epimerase family protein [Blastocatellia bacterium]
MSPITRRTFIQSFTAAVAAPAIIRARGTTKRLPIAVSTLGCPKWDWKTILSNVSQSGFAAMELRGILDQMDLPKVPEFTGGRLKSSMKDLSAVGLKISDLGASAQMHEPDPAKRAKQMDEAKRFIDLAYQMKSPYVRVFPNQLVKGEERRVTIERIISGLRELGEYAKGTGVTVIVESHGEFTNSPLLLEILKGAAMPSVAFLWDAHHTCVAGEKPEETYKQLGKYVRHTHLKDSVPAGPAGKERRYVLTGTGEVPVKETVRVLATNGYKGYYCYEWEKRWHPEIEEPEVAFPHYAKVMKEYLAEFGVRA